MEAYHWAEHVKVCPNIDRIKRIVLIALTKARKAVEIFEIIDAALADTQRDVWWANHRRLP